MEKDHSDRIDAECRRGRGAASNSTGRFEGFQRVRVDDGWAEEPLPPFRTEVSIERPKSVVSRNSSPDLRFDQSLNPYRGCEHGCIYCYARPTHAWLGYSPGLDFETKLIARPDAAKQLETELRRKSYRVAPLALGTNTDPYQPIEGRYRITRQVLEVLEQFQNPVMIITKGTLIERDLDILSRMAAKGLAQVGISITSLQPDLSRKMEPRVPSPKRRLQMIERLSGAGVPVRVMASPVVPGLTDHELEPIMQAGRDAGAVAASYILLRLPGEVAELFQEWLEEHYPDRAAKVMNRVREMRGGQDYQSEFGQRMVGRGVFAELLKQRFQKACQRFELTKLMPDLRCDLFEPPIAQGDQLSLF
ncbi:PA0069 family radical SAM protein [Aliiroseovarius sp. F20344]|uniref:PA0069 family radical SAM protein n=1 Tax=Aliiroseovarius sp. F20344 TaxID=2926414 RepID=UPI001FF300CD|nr:PA0069 family radical SAM protein [Aliiroseovarius sp. F20344]MCK0143516.1 PA0069 family radical SAM protein [Aliiroseovarius sp. F20344]